MTIPKSIREKILTRYLNRRCAPIRGVSLIETCMILTSGE